MNCSARASVLISCPLFSLQSFSSGAGWGSNTPRIGRDRTNKKWSIEYCGMSCAELGQDQSKLKCSLTGSLSSLSHSLSFSPSLDLICMDKRRPLLVGKTHWNVQNDVWSRPSALYCHLPANCTGRNCAPFDWTKTYDGILVLLVCLFVFVCFCFVFLKHLMVMKHKADSVNSMFAP